MTTLSAVPATRGLAPVTPSTPDRPTAPAQPDSPHRPQAQTTTGSAGGTGLGGGLGNSNLGLPPVKPSLGPTGQKPTYPGGPAADKADMAAVKLAETKRPGDMTPKDLDKVCKAAVRFVTPEANSNVSAKQGNELRAACADGYATRQAAMTQSIEPHIDSGK